MSSTDPATRAGRGGGDPRCKADHHVLRRFLVWGLDAEADERFTEPEKPRIADSKNLAAGVSGYGTDQEYLLLKKLWPQVKPAVVVLIFGTDNDRLDNSRGRRASPR